MLFQFKKILFVFIFNSCLFTLLIIGMQNSSNKSKVNFLIRETVSLPDSFIIGVSFVTGSVFGNLIPLKLK